jgi:phosphatidylglycerol:prolipoprotein diacylglycerol transferase
MVLVLKFGQRLKPGMLFCFYAIAYSSGRFWIEGLRTDSLMAGPLKMAQLVSLVGIVLGALGLWWFSKWKIPKG